MRSVQHAVAKRLRCNSEFMRIMMAELCGTTMLLLIGDGAIAQAVLSKFTAGNAVTIALGYGMAISMAIYACGGVSGGHINPAVTLAMCAAGKCTWTLLPAYWIGQYVGAFIGAALLYTVYSDSIRMFENGVKTLATAGIFATYPSEHVGIAQTFTDQVVATAILLIIICAVTDEQNMEVPKHLAPLAIGFGFFAILSAFGSNCGAPLNPARDFSPRLFTALAGWGSETFSARKYWFWVPIVGPHIGALIGIALYKVLIGVHWPPSHQITAVELGARQGDHVTLR